MANILFINIPAEGHVNPTTALVEELVKRGDKVTYYCVEGFRERLERVGATVRVHDNFMENTQFNFTLEERKKLGVQFIKNLLVRATYDFVELIWDQVQHESYDYVIYDNMAVAGWIIAEKLKLPKVASSTIFAMREESIEEFSMFKIESPPELYEQVEEGIQRLEQRHQIDLNFLRTPMGLFLHPVDRTIVFTSRLFQGDEEFFDDRYIFVGPSVTRRPDPTNFPLDELEDHRVIFISFGTIVNDQPEFFKACIEAFNDFDGKVVMSVGTKVDPSVFEAAGNHFIIRPYVPQLEVLERADVFFTHGGMNSASEGLYYGTPLAVTPLMSDQPIVAKRVVALGAGMELDQEAISADVLRETADQLLNNPSYREGAEAVSASFREAGGAAEAARRVSAWIESLKQTI